MKPFCFDCLCSKLLHNPPSPKQGMRLQSLQISHLMQPRVLWTCDTRASWACILRLFPTVFLNGNEQSCVNHKTPETRVSRRKKPSLNSLKPSVTHGIWQHPSDSVYFSSPPSCTMLSIRSKQFSLADTGSALHSPSPWHTIWTVLNEIYLEGDTKVAQHCASITSLQARDLKTSHILWTITFDLKVQSGSPD